MSEQRGFRLTNFEDHPSERQWMLFNFREELVRNEFAEELRRADIVHEVEDTREPPFRVAVKRRHREQAVKLNYLVIGRHRQPMIPDRRLGLALVLFVAAVVGLAFLGWLRR
jgi:hypothetical protein